jgi:hypothetical protein
LTGHYPAGGERIVALGALGLLVTPLRSWYTLDGVRLAAWDMLEYGRYLLLATAMVGLVLLIVVAMERDPPRRGSWPPRARRPWASPARCTWSTAW